MIYNLKNKIEYPKQDKLIATALDGTIYIENGRLHVNNTSKHLIYKPSASLQGWYIRNHKTLDDVYVGRDAHPTVNLEEIYVLDEELWQSLLEVKNDNKQTS